MLMIGVVLCPGLLHAQEFDRVDLVSIGPDGPPQVEQTAAAAMRQRGWPPEQAAMIGEAVAAWATIDSKALLVAHGERRVCLALARDTEARRAMLFAGPSNPASLHTFLDFLLAHERAHCDAWDDIETDAEWALWAEEARADHVALAAMRRRGGDSGDSGDSGNSGNSGDITHAIEAWRFVFYLFGGVGDHWSTPLIRRMPENPSFADVRRVLEALGGGPVAWDRLNHAWRPLRQALFAHPDGSAEQTQAWALVVAALPAWIAEAVPPLPAIRETGQRLWPQSADWRRESIWKR